MTGAVVDAVDVPVVASGGAGTPEHLRAVLAEAGASAALAASIFHYRHFTIGETKEYLASRGVPVRIVASLVRGEGLTRRIAAAARDKVPLLDDQPSELKSAVSGSMH
jgi:Histidine biosynthesis protein